MKKSESRKAWLMANMIFIATYALSFSTLLIRIPLFSRIPSLTYCILLCFIYGVSIYKQMFKDIKQVIGQQNFNCILFFLTLPNKILLLPFFIMSIINTSSYMCERKNKYENMFIYPIACDIMHYEDLCISLAYILEICLMGVSFVMMLFGFSSLFTFLSYLYLVVLECRNNIEMQKAFKIFRTKCDELAGLLPDSARENYRSMRNNIIKFVEGKDSIKND